MSLIIRININNKEIRCYSAQRITNTDMLEPHDTKNKYKIMNCSSREPIGYVTHRYDDPPERLVSKVMKLVVK